MKSGSGSVLFLFFTFFFSTCFVFAYSPTTQDQEILTKIYRRIDLEKRQQNPNYDQIINQKLSEAKIEDNSERFAYISNEAKKQINQQILDKKFQIINQYGQNIEGELDSRCLERYETIDQIAKEQNFPTALIIATWWREHGCRADNPKNGQGMFQIISSYRKPGPITDEEFKQQIVDFINFAKYKINWFEKSKNKLSNLDHFSNLTINLTYNDYDIDSVRMHSLLYNGLFKGRTLENSEYANANLYGKTSKRDGVATVFIKVLKREVEHQKNKGVSTEEKQEIVKNIQVDLKTQKSGYTIVGKLANAQNSKIISKIGIVSCDGNYSEQYDNEYEIRQFKKGDIGFAYNIKHKLNNVCEIPYKINFYDSRYKLIGTKEIELKA